MASTLSMSDVLPGEHCMHGARDEGQADLDTFFHDVVLQAEALGLSSCHALPLPLSARRCDEARPAASMALGCCLRSTALPAVALNPEP